jgi:amino acid transporter
MGAETSEVSLLSRLRLPEAVGLSLSIVSPTVTAAFNITLVVQATGPAAPLALAIGMVATGLVSLSFMAFTHRVAHAGSAYAYIAHTFGRRAGFIAGWTLLLTYLGFATGFAGLVGSFTGAALKELGIDIGSWWIAIGLASQLIAWWLAYRDMRLAGRLMLALEAIAVIAILVLCADILHAVHPTAAEVHSTFVPSAAYNGWAGLGFGMVYSMLSFAGFEGAATLGEETINPRRNIPIALLGTVILSGIFFVIVAYCEVIGYGTSGLKDLATSQAPLDDLALRYTSPRFATFLDLAAATSCFSGTIGGLAAAGRMVFALGRAGLAAPLATVHPVHRTPSSAVSLTAAVIIVPFLICAPFIGAGNYYSYSSTIGVLALILIYIGVGSAETVEGWRDRRLAWSAACALGPIILLWVLYRNLYPVPEFPNNLWPYVAFVWVMVSLALIRLRPRVAATTLAEYS